MKRVEQSNLRLIKIWHQGFWNMTIKHNISQKFGQITFLLWILGVPSLMILLSSKIFFYLVIAQPKQSCEDNLLPVVECKYWLF